MTTRSKIIIALSFVIVALLVALLISVSKTSRFAPQSFEPIPPPEDVVLPTSDRLLIRTSDQRDRISVKNFYPTALVVNRLGDSLIRDTGEYSFDYQSSVNSFQITIYNPANTLAQTLETAQADFVATLDIPTQQLCRLAVSIFIPASAAQVSGEIDESLTGRTYFLPICEQD